VELVANWGREEREKKNERKREKEKKRKVGKYVNNFKLMKQISNTQSLT
jgi:hypothetical protein